jgi:Tol biopolymer transport system component
MTSNSQHPAARPQPRTQRAEILLRLGSFAAGWVVASGGCTVAPVDEEMRQVEPTVEMPPSGGAGHVDVPDPDPEDDAPSRVDGPDGAAPASSPDGGAPASSPDGAAPASSRASCGTFAEIGGLWIGFDSDRAAYNRDLYAIRVDGSRLTRLTKGPSSEREPAFSQDGTRLAYVSDSSGRAQIFVYAFATGKSTQLTQLANGADQPSWSPDGRQLVFHSAASVHIMDADGGNQREITSGLDDFNAYKNPVLTADGSEVVFDRNNEINATRLDGGALRQIIHNWTTTIEAPTISPDGYNMAYSTHCSGGQQIVVVPLASDAVIPCEGSLATPSAEDARQPAWGPDHFIAYERHASRTSGPSQIAITAGPGAAPCTLEADGSTRDLNPAWAPKDFELPDDFETF